MEQRFDFSAFGNLKMMSYLCLYIIMYIYENNKCFKFQSKHQALP